LLQCSCSSSQTSFSRAIVEADRPDGARESAQDWRELLLDLQSRGLALAPELAVAEGEEIWMVEPARTLRPCNDRLASGCWLFGSLLRTLAVL
jgi:hypothetical protein